MNPKNQKQFSSQKRKQVLTALRENMAWHNRSRARKPYPQQQSLHAATPQPHCHVASPTAPNKTQLRHCSFTLQHSAATFLGPASVLSPISPSSSSSSSSSSCPTFPGLRMSVLSHNVLVAPHHTSAMAALPRASRLGFRVLGVQGFRATTVGVNNRMRAYSKAAVKCLWREDRPTN